MDGRGSAGSSPAPEARRGSYPVDGLARAVGHRRSPGREPTGRRSGRHRIAGRPDLSELRPHRVGRAQPGRRVPAPGSGCRMGAPGLWAVRPRSDRPGRAGRRRLIRGLVHLPIRGSPADSRGGCEGRAAENLDWRCGRDTDRLARSADHSGPSLGSRDVRGPGAVGRDRQLARSHRRRIRS